MKAKRNELLRHLSKLYCGGVVGEAVIRDKFASDVLSVDKELFVRTEGINGADPLNEPVGVLDLGLFINTLKVYGEDGNEQIGLEFEDNKIVVVDRNRGTIRLVSTAPSTIQTSIDAPLVEQILERFPKDSGQSFPQSTVEAILKSLGLLKCDVVRVVRNAKGTTFTIGNKESNQAEIELPAGKLRKGEKECDLLLSADKVYPVLAQLTDFSATQIAFTGPDSLVFIWDTEYLYAISPREVEK